MGRGCNLGFQANKACYQDKDCQRKVGGCCACACLCCLRKYQIVFVLNNSTWNLFKRSGLPLAWFANSTKKHRLKVPRERRTKLCLMSSLEQITEQLREFANERDWNQFHSAKNLILALVGEVGELASEVQWLTPQEMDSRAGDKAIADEIADIALYLIRLSDVLGIDLSEAISRKLAENAEKYPIEKSRGNALKYDKLT